MTRLSLRIQPAERVSIRTDRGRQGETGPAGYAVPIDGLTILANPLSDEAPPVAVNAEEARALIDAVSPSALQAALIQHRAEVFARVVNPGIDGLEWNNEGRPQFSNGPVFLLPSGSQLVSPTGEEYLITNE